MKNLSYTQQGDVILTRVDSLPENITKIKGTTVATGESVGNSHTFYDDDICLSEKFDYLKGAGTKKVNLYEDAAKQIWAEVLDTVYLRHQEHKPIEFKKGVYRIGIVREYDHVEKLSRKVVD